MIQLLLSDASGLSKIEIMVRLSMDYVIGNEALTPSMLIFSQNQNAIELDCSNTSSF